MPEWTTPTDPAPAAAPKPLASWYAQGLSDGLGDRLLMFDNSTAPSLELLRFRPDLADIPGFEAALREQVRRLDQFRHQAFVRIRAVQRLEPDDDLALISNCTPGKRLSEVLHRVRGPAVAAAVIEQLAPALVLFQQHDAGIAHGVLNPDRIIVSPEGQFTIVEHVVGPAIDALGLDTARLRSLGIALPESGEPAMRLDVTTDWYQLGLVAVSALLGRPVTASDLPQLERLLDGMSQSAGRDGTVLSPWIRQWLDRALQISSARIESRADASAALDELLDRERHGEVRRIAPARDAQSAPANVSAPDPIETVAELPPLLAEESRPTAIPAATVAEPVIVETPVDAESLIDFGSEEDEAGSLPLAGSVPKPQPAAPRPEPPFVAQVAEPQTPRVHAPQQQSLREARPEPQPIAPTLLRQPETVPVRPREPIAARAPRKPATPQPAKAAPRPPVVRDPNRLMPPRVQSQPAAVPPPPVVIEQTGFSTSVVVALVLIIAVQAGVIALMARALWFAPAPAIAVQQDASGENVLVSNKPAESTPLRLSAAPDLSWVSVTSPSVAGVVGAKGANSRIGTIKISSPVDLKVVENTRQIGSVPGSDLKVQPGRHEIELVNAALGYRLKQSIEIEAGQTVSIHVAPAQGWVNVFAVPAAEVSIDGQAVGRTPLGPLPLALGEHVVTFKHPTGATDRQQITVKSGQTVRVIGNPRR